jgi:ankyrin repeat protein
MDYYAAEEKLKRSNNHFGTATATLTSSRDSRGEKFLRACGTIPRMVHRDGESVEDMSCIKVLDKLYEESPNVVNYVGTFNINGVHCAAKSGNVVCLEWLLLHSADFTALTMPKEQNPAHLAAEYGNVDAVAFLIEHGQAHGVNFKAQDSKGRTPEDMARLYDQKSVLKCIKSVTYLQTLPKPQNRLSGNPRHTSNRLSQMDLVLEIQNLKILFDDEITDRKNKEEQAFFEVSQLKAEVSDLKTTVKALLRKLQISQGETSTIGDVVLGETRLQDANELIQDTGLKEGTKESNKK